MRHFLTHAPSPIVYTASSVSFSRQLWKDVESTSRTPGVIIVAELTTMVSTLDILSISVNTIMCATLYSGVKYVTKHLRLLISSSQHKREKQECGIGHKYFNFPTILTIHREYCGKEIRSTQRRNKPSTYYPTLGINPRSSHEKILKVV